MAKSAFLLDTQILPAWAECIVQGQRYPGGQPRNPGDADTKYYQRELADSKRAYGKVTSSIDDLDSDTEVLFLVIHGCGCCQIGADLWKDCRKALEKRGYKGPVVVIVNEGEGILLGDEHPTDSCLRMNAPLFIDRREFRKAASQRGAAKAILETVHECIAALMSLKGDLKRGRIEIRDLWKFRAEALEVKEEYRKAYSFLENQRAKRLAVLEAAFRIAHPALYKQ